jgi:hypothetical protein
LALSNKRVHHNDNTTDVVSSPITHLEVLPIPDTYQWLGLSLVGSYKCSSLKYG